MIVNKINILKDKHSYDKRSGITGGHKVQHQRHQRKSTKIFKNQIFHDLNLCIILFY